MRGCRKANLIGDKGKEGGRKTFIDDIISKVETSQRLSSQRPQTQHSFQIDYQTEEVVGPERVIEPSEYTEEPVEEVEVPVENIEEPIEDTEVEEPVQDIESPTESTEDQASASGKQLMEDNNEGLFGGGRRGEGRGENSLSTLEFPIGELPRGATPMENIPLSSMVYPLKILMSFFLNLIYCVEAMTMLMLLKN